MAHVCVYLFTYSFCSLTLNDFFLNLLKKKYYQYLIHIINLVAIHGVILESQPGLPFSLFFFVCQGICTCFGIAAGTGKDNCNAGLSVTIHLKDWSEIFAGMLSLLIYIF